MTKEEFNNQQWYKNMPVWANGQKCYVREVRFMTGEINVIYKIGATSGVTWDFCLVETSSPDPTALDLIAAEREKQISKGYTVEHDQHCNPECQLAAIASDLCFPYEIEQAPEPPVPINWNPEYWKMLINLPYKDRLRIAGAMLAAELDRVIHLENKES